MRESRRTRRRVLGQLAGLGIGIGVAGCTGTDSAVERASSAGSTTAGTSAATAAPAAETAATTTAPGSATTEATGSERASVRPDSAAGTETASGTTAGGGSTERGAYTVGMHTDLFFDPIGLLVESGETVSFELVSGVHSAAAYHPENEAAFDHRVPENAPAWNTGVFDSVGEFRNVTFETPGTHDYFCLPHKQLGMVGRIVVGEPGGPATQSPNPDGDLPNSARVVEQGAISYDEFESDDR